LSGFWVWGGYLTEGRAQLRAVLALPAASHASAEWAQLLWSAAFVEFFAGDYAAARGLLEQAVAVRRTIADPELAYALSYLGQVAREQEDYASAQTWLEESLSLSLAAGDRRGAARTLDRLGTIAQARGDYALARSRYEESLALARQADDSTEVAWSLHNLGCLALDQGDYTAARACFAQSLSSRDASDSIGFVHGLAELSVLAAAEGLRAAAVRLAGATAALIERTGIPVQHSERGRYEHWLARSREALGEPAAAAAWAEGQKMRLEQALAYALAPHEPMDFADSPPAGPRAAHTANILTLREREVAALIAQGRTNRQIAKVLVITERTVAAHVEHILNKLGFASRTQIGVWAAEHGLVESQQRLKDGCP
jgi:non-specific serine/threonine protein kinase